MTCGKSGPLPGASGSAGAGLSEEARAALPEGARAFLGAMERRYACKLFDPERLIVPGLEDFILECGRLSPSSFGLEHWRLVAVTAPALRLALFSACFAQEAVRTAPLCVACLVRRGPSYEPHSAFVCQRAERFPGGWPVFFEDYRGYYEYLEKSGRLEHWARAQTYIACANMMTGAASAGLDSCAIEGFDEEAVLAALGEDPAQWSAGLLAVFGHSAEPVRAKIREPLDSIVDRRP